MASVQLHPTLGLNPRITICPACKKDVGLVLLGKHDKCTICEECGQRHYGDPHRRSCVRCKSQRLRHEVVPEHEKIEADFCNDCLALRTAMHETLEDGGLLVVCEKCGSQSALPKDHSVTVELRKEHPTEKKLGIKIESCPMCDPEKYERKT